GGLLLEEGLLQRMRLFRGADAFDGRDRPARGRPERRVAGVDVLAVHDDGAGAALARAAAVAGALELEIVAKDVQERRVRLGLHDAGLAVDGELDAFGHGSFL